MSGILSGAALIAAARAHLVSLEADHVRLNERLRIFAKLGTLGVLTADELTEFNLMSFEVNTDLRCREKQIADQLAFVKQLETE
jgi:hypothetical protein